MHNGYCLKCRKKRGMEKAKKVRIKMRNYLQGVCGICGTKMSKLVKL